MNDGEVGEGGLLSEHTRESQSKNKPSSRLFISSPIPASPSPAPKLAHPSSTSPSSTLTRRWKPDPPGSSSSDQPSCSLSSSDNCAPSGESEYRRENGCERSDGCWGA